MNCIDWAGVCAVAVAIALLPAKATGESADDSPQNRISPQSAAAVNTPPASHPIVSAEASPIDHVQTVLNTRLKDTGLDFTETPLEQIASSLQDEYDVPIHIDVTALQAAGVTPQKQITVNLHNISLRSALKLMLRQQQLTYIVRDEVLEITTPQAARNQLQTCVYDVRALLSGESDVDGSNSLIDALTSCISPESWSENGGGQATIRYVKPGLFIVSQTQDIHDEIAKLLENLRHYCDSKSGKG